MTPNDTAKKARILYIGILVHDHKKERRGPRAQYMHVYSTLPFMIMNVTDHQKKKNDKFSKTNPDLKIIIEYC